MEPQAMYLSFFSQPGSRLSCKGLFKQNVLCCENMWYMEDFSESVHFSITIKQTDFPLVSSL